MKYGYTIRVKLHIQQLKKKERRKCLTLLLQVAIYIFVFFSNSNSAWAQNKTLDYFLQAAVSNSPLLKDYQNQILSVYVDSQRLRAMYKPQVSGNGNATYAPFINGYGYDPALTNYQAFNALATVNQTFIGRQNLGAQYYQTRLLNDSFRYAQKISEQDLKKTVAAQYITTYGDLQQLNFNIEINKMLNNQEEILKKLTQSNIYRQTDYLTFLVTLKQQELQMKQLQIQFRSDYSMLNYLCGIVDTSTVTLEPPNIDLADLSGLFSSAFFLRYKRDSLALQNEITLLKYSYRPKLSAFVNGGYSSTLLYEPYKNFGFSAGINLNVPIYDGHQRQLQERKINLLQNTSANYKEFFVRQYNQQMIMLRQQLIETESLISDINAQIKYAEGLIKINGQLLETGDAKISDFVIAINNYLTAKNLLAQNSISRMQIINQLNYWNVK